ncbi:UNVERIFIED_CONTAM: hypothetical protein FKN15_049839 [Acipenser sinensis]
MGGEVTGRAGLTVHFRDRKVGQPGKKRDSVTVKAPPELSKRVSTIRSTTTHHPTVSAPSTCTSALTQDW